MHTFSLSGSITAQPAALPVALGDHSERVGMHDRNHCYRGNRKREREQKKGNYFRLKSRPLSAHSKDAIYGRSEELNLFFANLLIFLFS